MENQEAQWLLSEKYGGVRSNAFAADQARLAAGEPLAYVIGYIPFLDCTIHLGSRPLIPRPETEYWTERLIQHLAQRAYPNGPRVLDLCAGSGCIGVAIAAAIPAAHVTFAEYDASHLPTIRANLTANAPQAVAQPERYPIYSGDLFAALASEPERPTFDSIATNPPYLDPALDRTEASVTTHEPHAALYGGADGLACITRIIADAPAYLAPGGTLWIEHEPEHTAPIAELAAANPAYTSCVTHTDQYGVDRFSVLAVAQ